VSGVAADHAADEYVHPRVVSLHACGVPTCIWAHCARLCLCGGWRLCRYWNAYTQSWLERYFYLRNSQAFGLNRWVTLLASAFWHGLFPGYYVTFGTMAAFMYLTPTITAGIKPLFYRPRVLALRVLFEVVTFFATQWMFTFIMAPFNLYTLEATAVAWAKWRYFGLWAPIVVYAVAMALMPLSRGKGKGKGKGKGTKAAAAIEPAAASDGEKKRK